MVDDIDIDTNSPLEKANRFTATQTVLMKPFLVVVKILTLVRTCVYFVRHVDVNVCRRRKIPWK